MIRLLGIFWSLLSIGSFSSATVFNSLKPEDFKLSYPKAYEHDGNRHHYFSFSSEFCKSCYISFDVLLTDADLGNKVEISDGTRRWELVNNKRTKYKRLKMPVYVTIDKSYNVACGYLGIQFTNLLFEFDPNIPMTQSFSATMGPEPKLLHQFPPIFFGVADVEINTNFYNNYEAGLDCHRLKLIGRNGEVVEVKKDSLIQNVKNISMPAKLIEDPICQSSGLSTPENKHKDYDVSLSLQLKSEAS